MHTFPLRGDTLLACLVTLWVVVVVTSDAHGTSGENCLLVGSSSTGVAAVLRLCRLCRGTSASWVAPGWGRAVLPLGSQPPRALAWKSLSPRLCRAGPSFLNKAGGWLPASCPEPRAGRPKAGDPAGVAQGLGWPPALGRRPQRLPTCSCPKTLVSSGYSPEGQGCAGPPHWGP